MGEIGRRRDGGVRGGGNGRAECIEGVRMLSGERGGK